jgi:hypothetical protein
VLYQSSASGNHLAHYLGVLCTKHLRNISKHWFNLLV